MFRDFAEGRATSKYEQRGLPAPADGELHRQASWLRHQRLHASLTPSLCSSLGVGGVHSAVQRHSSAANHVDPATQIRWLQDVVQNEFERLEFIANNPDFLELAEEADSEERGQGAQDQKVFTVERFLSALFLRFGSFK